jgi:hypothetical protein
VVTYVFHFGLLSTGICIEFRFAALRLDGVGDAPRDKLELTERNEELVGVVGDGLGRRFADPLSLLLDRP